MNTPLPGIKLFDLTGRTALVKTAEAENPRDYVPGNGTADEDALWARAREQAKSVCQSKGQRCSEVRITFGNRLPFSQRPADWSFSLIKT